MQIGKLGQLTQTINFRERRFSPKHAEQIPFLPDVNTYNSVDLVLHLHFELQITWMKTSNLILGVLRSLRRTLPSIDHGPETFTDWVGRGVKRGQMTKAASHQCKTSATLFVYSL